MRATIATLALLAVVAGAAGQTPPPGTPAVYRPGPGDVVALSDWPAIGKWMIDKHMQPAAWLGAHRLGKTLREPINVVLVDEAARSADEAVARLLAACKAAGYPSREGHSTGYHGYVGGVVYPQLPHGSGHAFSNEPFELHNNHGRIFGPVPLATGWMFVGALSREKFEPLTRTEHVYVSFNQARDHFARRLQEATAYKITGRVALANALVDDANATTGDHDGQAVVLKAER